MCLCSKVTPWLCPGDTSWRKFFPQTGGQFSHLGPWFAAGAGGTTAQISLYPQTVPSTGSSSTWTIFPICRIPCALRLFTPYLWAPKSSLQSSRTQAESPMSQAGGRIRASSWCSEDAELTADEDTKKQAGFSTWKQQCRAQLHSSNLYRIQHQLSALKVSIQ